MRKKFTLLLLFFLFVPTMIWAKEDQRKNQGFEENILFEGTDHQNNFQGVEIEEDAGKDFAQEGQYEKALVLEAKEPGKPDSYGNSIQEVKVRYLSGKQKGE